MYKNFSNNVYKPCFGIRSGKFADRGIELRLFSFVGHPGWGSGTFYYFKLNMFKYCIQIFKIDLKERYE